MNKEYGTAQKGYNVNVLPEAQPYYATGNFNADEGVHGIPLYGGEESNKPELKRFVVQGYKDLWATILFVLVTLTSLGTGICNLVRQKPSDENVPDDIITVTGEKATVTGVISSVYFCAALAAGASIVVASICFLLIRLFPRKMIIIANILTMLMNVAGAIAAFWLGAAMLGILLLLMCGMHALWFFLARSRIPLAAELLKSSVDVLSTYKTVYAVNLMMCFLCAGFTILWGYAMVPPLDRANKGTAGVGTGFLIFFLLLSLFWTQQVVGNLMHVTTAGLTATWYFAGKNNMPRNPTLASFKRGVTTSFGSICFGSLLVAIIRVIRVIVSSAENSNHEVLRCIFLCIINCLENLLEYFNTYAFVHVAIYGCGYIEAAKKTWELCKQCAFAAIFNDSFIDVTLSLLIVGGSLLIGAIIGFLYFSYVAFAVAFLVSILVHSLLFAPITSGVTTFFVCYAEVPEGLQHSAPELYAAIHSADQNGTGNNAQAPRV